MASVASCLLQEMSHDPPEVDGRLVVEWGAGGLKICVSYDGIRVPADLLITHTCTVKSRRVRGIADCHVSSGESVQDPRRFRVRDVIDEPEQRGAGTNW